MGSFSNLHISKCAMMPKWHQLIPISGDVEELETVKTLQLYATSRCTSVSTRIFRKLKSNVFVHTYQNLLTQDFLSKITNMEVTEQNDFKTYLFHKM